MITQLEMYLLQEVYNYLFLLSKSEDFWDIFSTIFGVNYDVERATTLHLQWEAGDFSDFPEIQVVSNDVLGGANGGYAIATNKIYLSEEFLADANSDSVVAVLLEEQVHYLVIGLPLVHQLPLLPIVSSTIPVVEVYSSMLMVMVQR